MDQNVQEIPDVERSNENGQAALKTEDVKSDSTVVAPSEWDLLRAQLREKSHDPEGWNKLAALAEESGDIEKVKESYEALLEMYPNTVSLGRYVIDSCGGAMFGEIFGIRERLYAAQTSFCKLVYPSLCLGSCLNPVLTIISRPLRKLHISRSSSTSTLSPRPKRSSGASSEAHRLSICSSSISRM